MNLKKSKVRAHIGTAQCYRLWEQICACSFVCIFIFPVYQWHQCKRFQRDFTTLHIFQLQWGRLQTPWEEWEQLKPPEKVEKILPHLTSVSSIVVCQKEKKKKRGRLYIDCCHHLIRISSLSSKNKIIMDIITSTVSLH